jgi:PAS domain S-box-containing protein
MNHYAVIPMVSYLAGAAVWFYVLARSRRDSVTLWFLGFSACGNTWAFFEFLSWSPLSDAWLTAVMAVEPYLWLSVGFLFLRFTYAFLGRPRDALFNATYGAYVIALVLQTATDAIVGEHIRHTWGVNNATGPLFEVAVLATVVAPMILGAALLFLRRRSSRDARERTALGLLIAGVLTSLVLGVGSDVVSQSLLGFTNVPELAASGTVISSLFAGVAVARYGFLSVGPEDVAIQLFHSVNDGVVISDDTGRVVLANPAAEKLLGLPRPPGESITLSDCFENYQKSGTSYESRVAAECGDAIVSMAQSTVTLPNRGTMTISILRDVTAEREAQNALAANEAKFRDLAEMLPEIVFEIDTSGRFTYINKAGLASCGYTPGRVERGIDALELVTLESRERFDADIRERLAGKGPGRGEYLAARADGSAIPVSIRSAPIVRDGDVVGVRGIAVDISERKRFEEDLAWSRDRLAREIEEKNDFLRVVSHDLGAPLRNIQGMVDSITRNFADELSEGVRDRLARVRRNATKQMGFIDELLELSRIRTRRESPQAIDVGTLVKRVVEALSDDIERKGISVRIADLWPTIRCEGRRIAQALQNYVDNSAKYMPDRENPEIEIGWREEVDAYVFWVKDNGQGIHAKDLGTIFQVFRRGRGGAGTEGKGVGLATVKAIAETYDGEAWAESTDGAGSAFYLSLAKRRVSTGQTNDAS